MGTTWSGEPPKSGKPRHKVKSKLSYFEKISLHKNLTEIQEDDVALITKLGLANVEGNDLVLRMAQNLTDNNLYENIEFVVGYMDQRLRNSLSIDTPTFYRSMFNSLCLEGVGDEKFLSYDDFQKIWRILVSAIDTDPRDLNSNLELLEVAKCEYLISDVKSPAIRYDQFERMVKRQPFIFNSLKHIWDRLLYDLESINYTPEPVNIIGGERWIHNIMLTILGPIVLESMRLYKGRVNGFSMQAFEQKVTKWPAPSLMIIKGHQAKDFETNWKKKQKRVDKIIPSFYDCPLDLSRKHVLFCVYADTPWKKSHHHCFGDTGSLLIQLRPVFRVFQLPTKSIFFTPKLGLGAGFIKPPSVNDQTLGPVLYIDDLMEHGVLRVSSELKYEHRFYVDQLEVFGLGDSDDLAAQQKEWDWEEQEAHRRRNINIQEDRALLEMAGIAYQYEG